ncbi:RNA pyrophosphohydrolase [Helicobacter sp. MIT 21-1697]|uniref:RNA pyrophosphohydrolase n=1 Tax=Helicobacter sp. MIT 21-1697 TaxID=2993733 RepID=UPI00224A57DB|nr:RNA pyrophosphohydrolase [Helicobacter sp. MIT 21-1697]MCX2716247.1 RNA pyrophosphohydrolase [Helicobacter sp. MIT 21-1697]
MKSSCTQENLQHDTPTKKYRPNVAAVILSSAYPKECRFFIAQRSDIKDAWQFPQGGIDEGESPRDALFRELREEIGTDEIEIISECPEWIQYDFPKNMSKKKYKGFAGQIQKYFLVRLKNDTTINLQTQEPEFNKYKFVSKKKLLEYVTPFKKEAYKQVLKYFKKEGYL